MFFGDADIPVPTTIVGAFIAISISLVGLVAWILRHLFQTTIPDINKTGEAKHAAVLEEVKAGRVAHEATIARLCDTFQRESEGRRKECEQEVALINASIAGLTTAVREGNERIVASVNQHTTEQVAVYRHDIYDKINEAVMGRELALATKKTTAARLQEEGRRQEAESRTA